jgi:hypothetical protein
MKRLCIAILACVVVLSLVSAVYADQVGFNPDSLYTPNYPDVIWNYENATVLTVAKEGADFTSIQAAIDSIGETSKENTYVIKVMPGTYYERVMLGKDYVDIVGSGVDNTIIEYVNLGWGEGNITVGLKGINGLHNIAVRGGTRAIEAGGWWNEKPISITLTDIKANNSINIRGLEGFENQVTLIDVDAWVSDDLSGGGGNDWYFNKAILIKNTNGSLSNVKANAPIGMSWGLQGINTTLTIRNGHFYGGSNYHSAGINFTREAPGGNYVGQNNVEIYDSWFGGTYSVWNQDGSNTTIYNSVIAAPLYKGSLHSPVNLVNCEDEDGNPVE